MAEVFKARRFSDGGFQMLLVIKRILQQYSENEEFIQMFIDEAKISVELQHPNIVKIYDFGKLHDNYFLAMECVEGKDLKSILRTLAKRRKLLPSEFAVYIAHEMCKGLDYAHKKADIEGQALGIVHRDISPSNILISYDGDIKIADFGIAKAQISVYNTKDGVLKGKFEYMSPEQASGKDIDFRSDVFSAGILLHEMLTGRRLFKTDSDVKTLEKIKAVDIAPPSARNPNVSDRLDELVMKALSQDPENRFKDAKEMQAALAQYLYPATPSITADQLSVFMQELFREEIAAERQRLQEGTRIATTLNEQTPEEDPSEDWSGGQGSGTTIQQPSSRMPLIIAAVAVVALLGVLAWALTRPPQTERIEVAAESKFGSLQIRIRPEGTPASFFLNGEQVGEGELLTLEELTPGQQQTLRVEAEGYFPYEEVIVVEAGERLRLPVPLLSNAQPSEPDVIVREVEVPSTPAPITQPPDTPAPPIIAFSSVPSKASVYVDGSLIGKTPLTWSSGTPGSSVQVEYQLSGYSTARFSTAVPEEDKRESISKTLKAKAAAPGTVRINVRKSWANVYVDGKSSGTTPLTVELSPGSHTIRVQNTDTGYEAQETISVISGQLLKITL